MGTDVPARPRSVLICHRGALLDRNGLSAWLASFSDLAGIVELSETTGRTMQRIKAQVRRSGVWRLLDVFALPYYRLTHATADRQFSTTPCRRSSRGSVRRRTCPCCEPARSMRPRPSRFSRAAARTSSSRCKTLLKPAVFQVPSHGTYVLHPGVCPEAPQRARMLLGARVRRSGTRGPHSAPDRRGRRLPARFTVTSATRSTSDRKATCGSSSAC